VVARHLTDEEIQAYLDGSAAEIDAGLRAHLETCRQCRELLGDYEALYARLADRPGLEAPQDLARSVISRLGLEPARGRFSVPGDLVLVAGAIAAMVITAFVFLDLGPVFDTASAIGGQISTLASAGLEAAHERARAPDSTLSIYGYGIAILAIMGVLDAAFRRKLRAATRRGPR
jgi:anti-sigma factor RsiW